MLRRWLRDHSLTVTLTAVGLVILGGAMDGANAWDLVSGLGQGFLTAGLVFALQGPLREVSRPEE